MSVEAVSVGLLRDVIRSELCLGVDFVRIERLVWVYNCNYPPERVKSFSSGVLRIAVDGLGFVCYGNGLENKSILGISRISPGDLVEKNKKEVETLIFVRNKLNNILFSCGVKREC